MGKSYPGAGGIQVGMRSSITRCTGRTQPDHAVVGASACRRSGRGPRQESTQNAGQYAGADLGDGARQMQQGRAWHWSERLRGSGIGTCVEA